VRLIHNLSLLQQGLAEGTYRHGAYIRFGISDPKPRLIHKASVRDRVVHHLLYRILYNYFDARFVYDSYSCRIDKGTHKALERFKNFSRAVSQNYTSTAWVLKCDIRKFFANIDHFVLKEVLYQHIDSPETLWLLENVIDSFSTEGKAGVGLPLGNLTSQLLVNVYMNEFDQFVKHQLKVKHYIRYADDFVFLSRDRNYLFSLLPQIDVFLKDRLHLELHPDKVSITTIASGIDFLGWVHFPQHRVLRTVAKRRMFRALGKDPKEARVLSYLGMLSHGNAYRLSQKVSETITRS
ncbi:MAG: RNA-directed DNA polymerase (Reverse transcriptase), partial [Parcubacteria group bacterium Gr01-1014_91]